MSQEVAPTSFLASNNLFFIFIIFRPTSLAQLHNVYSTCKLLSSAARCHTMCPELSMANNNLFFNSYGFSWPFLTHSHSFFFNSNWTHFAANFQAVYPCLFCNSSNSIDSCCTSFAQLRIIYNMASKCLIFKWFAFSCFFWLKPTFPLILQTIPVSILMSVHCQSSLSHAKLFLRDGLWLAISSLKFWIFSWF